MVKSHYVGSVVPVTLQVTFNLQRKQLSTESAHSTPCSSTWACWILSRWQVKF